MNTFSLYAEQDTCTTKNALLFSLDEITGRMGWVWGAGEDQQGYWCTLYTSTEMKTFRASSLLSVIQKTIAHIGKTYPYYAKEYAKE